MTTRQDINRLLTLATLALITTHNPLHAEESASSPPKPIPEKPIPASVKAITENPTKLETIVITGTAQSEGVRKVDASFSITTATDEEIKKAAPSSTADLLKLFPV